MRFDSHALFCREKFAYALAVLDGRVDMASEDWELSGVAAAVSAHIRDRVTDNCRKLRRAADEAGALHGVSQEAADNEKTSRAATGCIGCCAGCWPSSTRPAAR